MNARVRRTMASSLVTTAVALVGCTLIVPNEMPAYRCVVGEPSSCPSGLTCDSASLRCVAARAPTDSGAQHVDDDASAGADAKGEHDEPAGPSPIGGDCVVDGDCAEGLLCGTSTILTTAIASASSKPICTAPCCRSSDCPTGFVCFSGGTGGNYCVAASKAKRAPPPTGGRAPGQACGAHDQCRSGLCDAGRCVDTCCEPGQCAPGSTCRISTVDGHASWACGAPNAEPAKALTMACSGNVDCANDNCVQPFSAGRRCTPTCCGASDCAALGFINNVCAYGSAGNDHLKWCFEPNASGAPLGATCAADTDCASRYCDSELGRCADVCCTTADCASGESCKPSPVGTPYLRCVKNR